MAKSLLIIASCIFIGAIGQFLLKSGMDKVGRVTIESLSNPVGLITSVAKTPVVIIGLLMYMVGAALWLIVLSRENLSFAYPLIGSTYILVVLISRFLLNETVSPIRWVGALIISLGVVLITRS